MTSYKTLFLGASIVAASLLFSGCGSDSSSDTTPETNGTITNETNTTIPNESNETVATMATSYASYRSGIISADTLVSYIDNWEANRPADSNGRLVIIQAGATSSGKFIKNNEASGVYVYQIPATGACDPSYMRHDGVANIPGALLSGEYADMMINQFHLDPANDTVVFAMGIGSTTLRDVVRSYWVLSYWGWPKERIAFLNGSVDYNFAPSSDKSDYLVDAPSTPPATPSSYTMKSMQTNNTDLHIYIDDMMKIASLSDQSGYFIADARGTEEYSGATGSKTADKNCGPSHNEQCYSPYQGHIRGAVDLPYTDLLIRDDQSEDVNNDGNITGADASFKFKSPADLEALFAAKGYQKGDKVITYCRTGRKATLVALVSYGVLNYDVAMYDGSWIQWGEMANATDVNGSEILPAGNPWITMDEKYSVILSTTEAAYTQSAAPYAISPEATNAQNVKNEDLLYLGL